MRILYHNHSLYPITLWHFHLLAEKVIADTATDCSWSPWYPWSRCSKSCDGGNRTSTRTISVVAYNGGKDCEGNDTRVEECNSDPCPGRYKS